MLATREMLERYDRLRNRNANHPVGTELFYYDQHCRKYRPAVVTHIHKHFMTTYYVMEVDTGPPINDTYLHMSSHHLVRTRDQLDREQIVDFYKENQ